VRSGLQRYGVTMAAGLRRGTERLTFLLVLKIAAL
jgi:hypothetical protein